MPMRNPRDIFPRWMFTVFNSTKLGRLSDSQGRVLVDSSSETSRINRQLKGSGVAIKCSIYPYNGILFSLKKELSNDTRYNVDEPYAK